MGFDPRRWRPASGSRPVTASLDDLIAENELLRREVRQLRELLERQRSAPGPGPGPGPRPGAGREAAARQRVTRGTAPGVTPLQVRRWGEAMARHPAWEELRIGPPGGLRGLVEQLRARAWNPALSLEEELDRRQNGLGAELAEALRGPHSRTRWAVRAAFALYGPTAIEWLNDEPLRVVGELRRRLERLDPPRSAGPDPAAGPDSSAGRDPWRRRRGTRTENHSQAGSRPGESARATAAPDPRREALSLLGLEVGASLQQIKRTYRQLAKRHHPDLGGDAEAFRRLDAAYRLLIGG